MKLSEQDEVSSHKQMAEQIAMWYLSPVLRFQAAPGIYNHMYPEYNSAEAGLQNTRAGELNPLFEPSVSGITDEFLEQCWMSALSKIREPQLSHRIRGRIVSQNHAMHPRFVPAVHTYGLVPLEPYFEETVLQHVWDMDNWLSAFMDKGLLPPIDREHAREMIYLHDLGEALHGDIALLRGKTPEHEKMELDDFSRVIDFEQSHGRITPGEGEEMRSVYAEFNACQTLEAQIVKVIDGFVGSLRHIHTELKLNVDHLKRSLGRVGNPFEKLNTAYGDDYNLAAWNQNMRMYFIPSRNWVRFADKNGILQPSMLEY